MLKQTLQRKNPPDWRNLVVFRLGQQTCALPIEPIVRIIPLAAITPAPQADRAPANRAVEGVIDVDGMSVPAVNLRRHLGLRRTARRLRTPVLLVQAGSEGDMVGLIVDEVGGVLSVPAEEVADFADFLPGRLREVPILQGLAYVGNGTVLLLDVAPLFSF